MKEYYDEGVHWIVMTREELEHFILNYYHRKLSSAYLKPYEPPEHPKTEYDTNP